MSATKRGKQRRKKRPDTLVDPNVDRDNPKERIIRKLKRHKRH